MTTSWLHHSSPFNPPTPLCWPVDWIFSWTPMILAAGKANTRIGWTLATESSPLNHWKVSRQGTLLYRVLALADCFVGSCCKTVHIRSQNHGRHRGSEEQLWYRERRNNELLYPPWTNSTCQQPPSPLDILHDTHFRFQLFFPFIDGMLTTRSPSHFSGAHHFVSNGGTYNNIFGNYVVVAGPSDAGWCILHWNLVTCVLFRPCLWYRYSDSKLERCHRRLPYSMFFLQLWFLSLNHGTGCRRRCFCWTRSL